jgi:hypothetical protein
MSFFAGLWPIIGHYTLGVSFVGACIAIAIFSAALQAELSSIPLIGGWLADNIRHIREWAIVAAGIAAVILISYGVGVSNGEARVKAQWAAAEQAAIQRGNEARSSAERSVKRDASPSGLRNDPYNRDHP